MFGYQKCLTQPSSFLTHSLQEERKGTMLKGYEKKSRFSISAKMSTTTLKRESSSGVERTMESSAAHRSIDIKRSLQRRGREYDPDQLRRALRTAFVARFIVLREGRRSRAHRIIESLGWSDDITAEELANMFRQAFLQNGDKMQPVERDIQRALVHAERSATYFLDQYLGRSCLSFKEALVDYVRSNSLLFGEDEEEVPRSGGWRLPQG